MIIAAYAGCGKTTFAKKYEDICTEVASMPYARILPINREETTESFEREKAAPYHNIVLTKIIACVMAISGLQVNFQQMK